MTVNVIEMEVFRLKRELRIRQGKSIAGKVVAGHTFDKIWMSESGIIEKSNYKLIIERQNREIEIERQKHKELIDG